MALLRLKLRHVPLVHAEQGATELLQPLGTYAGRFNKRHKRWGHLFGGRFKSLLIEKEAYLTEVLRYVVLNPVRAGMV